MFQKVNESILSSPDLKYYEMISEESILKEYRKSPFQLQLITLDLDQKYGNKHCTFLLQFKSPTPSTLPST